MVCPNCGDKTGDDSQFCQNCGRKVSPQTVIRVPDDDFFYSENWTRARVLRVASSVFDILIDGKYFYLIELDDFHGEWIGTLLGLPFWLLGAVIGNSIGHSIDKKKRSRLRSSWFNPDGHLILKTIESHIFLRIPMDQVANRVTFKGKYVIVQGQEKLTLRKTQRESERLAEFLGAHA